MNDETSRWSTRSGYLKKCYPTIVKQIQDRYGKDVDLTSESIADEFDADSANRRQSPRGSGGSSWGKGGGLGKVSR